MKNFKATLLYKKWFLFAVFILLMNDFFLKYQFHNTLTGKLSDFAGLFAFPYFISLFTKRIKLTYILTAVFFIFWKTELSQTSIDFLNSFNFNLYRIVDYTDFIAFLILPISYKYRVEEVFLKRERNSISKLAIVFIACFSFIATTQRKLLKNYCVHAEELNMKSHAVIDFSYGEEQLWDGIGYKPLYRNKGYNIVFNDSSNLRIYYKVSLLHQQDSTVKIGVDSVLRFHYECNYYSTEDSIRRNKAIDMYRKMKLIDFEKILADKINNIK